MSRSSDSFDFSVIVTHTFSVDGSIFVTQTLYLLFVNWSHKLSYDFFCYVPTNVFFVIFSLLSLLLSSSLVRLLVRVEVWDPNLRFDLYRLDL